jgi:hypothetical protein
MDDIEKDWNELVKKLNKRFDADLDIQAIIFLIGVQELGKGYVKLNKSQKTDVMHIATCRLLSHFGYYEFEGIDADGWPHWKATATLPHLKSGQQLRLMKEAIIDYFSDLD